MFVCLFADTFFKPQHTIALPPLQTNNYEVVSLSPSVVMLTPCFFISAENRQMENSLPSKKKCVPASPDDPRFLIFKKTFFFSLLFLRTRLWDTETFSSSLTPNSFHFVFLKRCWGDVTVQRWTFLTEENTNKKEKNKQLACVDNETKWLLVRVPWVTPW